MTEINTSNLGEIFGSNLDESENGKWVSLTPKLRLKIRRATSEAAQKVHRKIYSAYAGRIPRKLERQLTIRFLTQGVIVDIEGLEVNGKPMKKYDPQVVEELMTKYPEFVEFVSLYAVDAGNFRTDTADEELVKN